MNKWTPGLIGGAVLGGIMWIATGTFWWLPAVIVVGLAVVPLVGREDRQKNYARKKRDDNFRD